MRIGRKFRILAVCVILILSPFLISVALGDVNIKKAITGKWERYDPKYKGKETIEFFEDGTFSTFHEGFGFPIAGDYRFIDKNRIRIDLGGFWGIAGPIVCKVSISRDKLILALPDGRVEEYQRIASKVVPSDEKILNSGQSRLTSEFAREKERAFSGEIKKIKKLNHFFATLKSDVLNCPKDRCDNYEEEAAKVLISHLLTKESGKWLSGFIAWQVAKKLILSGLDEITQMAISLGEAVIVEKIREIKDKFEKSHGADIKVFSLVWKDIGVLPTYFPYKERDGRYGNVDGEALMVFYSPHSISIKEIKDQVKSGGGRFGMYVPPIGLDKKLRQLPDEGIVRPFNLIIRGTVYELGEVITYESWGETIKGPLVTFLEDKETVSTKVQITSSLRILESTPHKVGDTITAEFSIKNTGTAPITFDVLTVGGRLNGTCPQDICPDFTWKENVTLRSNDVYPYKGELKLKAPGNYHFFTAYRTKDGQWNTTIPTAPGILNKIDIKVLPPQDLSCPQGVEYPDMAHHKNAFDKAGLRGYSTWYVAERWLWDRDEIEMGDYVAFKPKARVWSEKEELPSIGPAYRWAKDAKKKGLHVDPKKPVKGSIAVFGATSNNWAGHVAYVESVNEREGSFTISQMNAGSRIDPKTLKTECFNKITMETIKIGATTHKGMKILGFIYPPNYPAESAHIISGKYVPTDKDKLFLAKNWRDWELEFREDGSFSWKWSLGGRWEIEENWIMFAFYPSPKEDEYNKRLFLKEEVRYMRNLEAQINGDSLKEFTGVIPLPFDDISMLKTQQDAQLIKKIPKGRLWDRYIAYIGLKSRESQVVTLELRRDKTFRFSVHSIGKWEGTRDPDGSQVIDAYFRYPERGDHFRWRFLIKDDNKIVEEYEGINFVKFKR